MTRLIPSSQTVTVEIEDQPILGCQWLVSGVLEVTFVRDRNADCDADGNRGHDVTYEDERVWTLVGAARRTVDDWEDVGLKDIPQVVKEAAEKWADAHPVDREPFEEPEPPDYDREDR